MMAHGAYIRKTGNDPDGVGYAFAFGSRGGGSVRKTDDAAAQIQHGCFKTESCSGTGFVKTSGKLLAFAHFCIFLHIVFDIIGKVEKLVQFFDGEIKGTH